MFSDKVSIEEANVYGISHAKFIMRGSLLEKEAKFKILVDGKEKEYKSLPALTNCGFHIETPLEKNDKEIKVYLCTGKKEQLICTRKNSSLHRRKRRKK